MKPALNKFGEIPDAGPPWSCKSFGGVEHDYQNCPDCMAEFKRHIAQETEKGRRAVRHTMARMCSPGGCRA
jgi:hypothetical protein